MVDQAKCFMAFFFVLLGPLEGRNILLGPLDGTNMMGILFTILTLTLNRLQISRATIISSPTAIFRKITRLFSIILDDRVIVICQYIRIRRGNCSDLDKLPDRLTVVLPCLPASSSSVVMPASFASLASSALRLLSTLSTLVTFVATCLRFFLFVLSTSAALVSVSVVTSVSFASLVSPASRPSSFASLASPACVVVIC